MPRASALRMFLLGALIGAGLAAFGVLPAAAADMARGEPRVVKAPEATPTFSWTGFYIGGNAGYGWGSGEDALGAAGIDPKGWLAGGQAGFNYQFANNIVAGIEADIQGGDVTAAVPGLSSTLDMFGTVRGRLGYAFGPVLPYATGGFAYGNNTLSIPGVSQSQTLTGWTAGAGIEYALSEHWTAKTEYLYTDLGSKSYNALGTAAGVTTQTGRIGINYKF